LCRKRNRARISANTSCGAASGRKTIATFAGVGAQIYECKAGSDGKLAWSFREPIAALVDKGKTRRPRALFYRVIQSLSLPEKLPRPARPPADLLRDSSEKQGRRFEVLRWYIAWTNSNISAEVYDCSDALSRGLVWINPWLESRELRFLNLIYLIRLRRSGF
jgi:hypothetical protein